MFAKAPMATCIISQICFDADVIAGWVRAVRARGTHLPIWIGLPGQRRLREARADLDEDRPRGVGALPAPSPQLDVAADDAPFKPDPLVDGLAPTLADPAAGVAGFHLYTFNEVGRDRALAAADAGAAGSA